MLFSDRTLKSDDSSRAFDFRLTDGPFDQQEGEQIDVSQPGFIVQTMNIAAFNNL